MRRLHLLSAAIPLLAASMAFAAGSGISGSAHDFSRFSWSEGEICKPCHTPHNALVEASSVTGRLWNHTLSTASYTLHGARGTGTGTTTDATKSGGQADMDSGSRLCLSCHDGTVALDSFGGKTGSVTVAGSINLGTDLSNDHPVGLSVVYDEMAGSAGHYRYQPIATAKAAGLRFADLGSATSYTYTDRGGASVTTNKMAVSCVSCHDVHNGSGFEENLLRADNAGSKLCLSCHAK